MDKSLNAGSLSKLVRLASAIRETKETGRVQICPGTTFHISVSPRVSSTLLVEWQLLIKDKTSYFPPEVCVFCLVMGTKVIGALVCVPSMLCFSRSGFCFCSALWKCIVFCLQDLILLALLGHSSFKTQPRRYFLSKPRPPPHLNTQHTTHTPTNIHTHSTRIVVTFSITQPTPNT